MSRDAYPWPDVPGPGTHSLYGEELSPGALVGGFLVERTRYRGAMATLYRARDTRTGGAVALKVLHLQFATARGALRRFQQEGETLRRLRHPHIVDVLEHGTLPDGRPFIAMEWLEGRDLGAELQARGPLSAREALEVLEQVGAALGAAHGADVVHRDLKAQNVMVLGPSGTGTGTGTGTGGLRVKLVDFGVAKLLAPGEAGSGATSTGLVLGTPLNMAPEQIRGETPDARTDVYALGVLLYQLVTGQPPFLGPSHVELEEQHLHAPVPRASHRAPVPARLDAVVARCMEKTRAARPARVDEVLAELRRAVGGGGGGGGEERAPARQQRALGLYVEARLSGTTVDDDVLDALDTRLEEVRARADALGLKVLVEGGNFLLGVASLPEEPEAERELRRRVLELALTLSEERTVGGAARARVSLVPTLHVDLALLRSEGPAGASLAGGRLMRLSAWTGAHPGQGVVATEAALAGLEAGLATRPLSGRPTVHQVWRTAS